MLFNSNELASAVLFFSDDGAIANQMQWAEFEAVLAGYVALDDLRNTKNRAVYVELDSKLHVQRLVFFTLQINANGFVSPEWRIPLADVAAAAATNKDLGGGPVRIACHSNCPIPHLRHFMWDPDLSPRNNHLNLIKRAVSENRLGFTFKAAKKDTGTFSEDAKQQLEQEITSRLRREYAKEFRDHMAQLLKEQRLRISTTREEARQDIADVKVEYERRLADLRAQLERNEAELKDQIKMNADLRDAELSQLGKIEAIRNYYEQKLNNIENSQNTYEDTYRQAIEVELKAKFEVETRVLKSDLQTKEVELLYRNEMEVQLHEEIARLREQNQKALENTGEQLLSKLVESGVSLVSFQPGAGHLTIPLNEIFNYIDDPTAYSAEKCHVTKAHYVQWLTHYRMPVCENVLEQGQVCGENIERVENPIDFKPGESNWCANCQKKQGRAHLRLA